MRSNAMAVQSSRARLWKGDIAVNLESPFSNLYFAFLSRQKSRVSQTSNRADRKVRADPLAHTEGINSGADIRRVRNKDETVSVSRHDGLSRCSTEHRSGIASRSTKSLTFVNMWILIVAALCAGLGAVRRLYKQSSIRMRLVVARSWASESCPSLSPRAACRLARCGGCGTGLGLGGAKRCLALLGAISGAVVLHVM